LIGQDHVRTSLQNALKHGRLHHALLFTGPRGTGKTSTARILAKSLRCPNAQDYIPCNACAECEEIASGRSLNVIEIDGASNNGVDAIRELRDTVGYMPSSGRFKLYIIDEVHMLSTSAFNALLKTLEEPPSHVYFVMATTESHKIPNTILSRCQRFDFRRIPTRVILQHLQTICERDQIHFETEALWTIARQGDGSMRDAQSLLDQTINFTNGRLERDQVVASLGLTDRGLLLDILTALIERKTSSVVEVLQRFHQSGGEGKLFLLDIMEQIRNTLLLKIGDGSSLVDLPDSEREALRQLGTGRTVEDLHLLFDMCLKGAGDMQRASDPALVLEMVLLRMSHAPSVGSFTATAGQQETAPSRPNRSPEPIAAKPMMTPASTSGPVPVAPSTTSKPAAAPVATPAAFTPMAASSPPDLRYKELVEKIKEVNGLIGAQLENCFVVRLENKSLTLGVATRHKFLFEKINQDDFKRKVGNYLNTFWGPGYALTVVLSDPGTGLQQDVPAPMTPKVLSEKMEGDRQQSVRKAVEAHPLVQTAQNVFKTEIRSIHERKINNGPDATIPKNKE